MEAISHWYYNRSYKKAGAPEKVKAARSGPGLIELFMKKNESKSDQSKQGMKPSNDLQDLSNQHESEKSRQGTETIAESTALSQDLQCTEGDLESVGGDTDILILKVAKEVTSKGFVKVRDAFELCSPGVKYSSFQARRMLLQMPLAVIGVGTLKEETFCLYLVEKCKPPNLFIMQTLIKEATLHKSSTQKMTQDEMKKLLALAESESERKRLKYAVVKSAGMSNTKAKRVYGVSGVSDTKQKVEQATEDACAIREAIENIAKVKDKAVLQSMGVRDDSDSDEAETMNTESETDTGDDVTEDQPLQAH
ncbi:hypothetical protein ACROYT_G005266 [Oculina patagonica]